MLKRTIFWLLTGVAALLLCVGAGAWIWLGFIDTSDGGFLLVGQVMWILLGYAAEATVKSPLAAAMVAACTVVSVSLYFLLLRWFAQTAFERRCVRFATAAGFTGALLSASGAVLAVMSRL